MDLGKFSISKPTLRDIPAMRNLILPEVQRGIILDRSEDEMASAIRSYSVVRIGNSSLTQSSRELEKSAFDRQSVLSQADFPAQPTNLTQDTRIAENLKKSTDSGTIIAFAALQILSPTLAEIRSLIVAESHRRLGIATALILHLIDEGKALNLKEILTLTYQKEVFAKIGFVEIAKDSLPNQKIWADCIKCKKFPICDEIALLKTL